MSNASFAALPVWAAAWLQQPDWLALALLLFFLLGTSLLLSLPSYGLPLMQWLAGRPRTKPGDAHRPGRGLVASTASRATAPDPGPSGSAEPGAAGDPGEPALQVEAAHEADRHAGAETRCKMDLAATSEGLELILELPGLQEKDLQIRFTDGAITISGEIKRPFGWTDKGFRVVERDYGPFSRSIELPEGVRTEGIKAVLNLGLLKVTIPNPIKPEPKTIVIQAGPMHLNPTREGLELLVDLPGLDAQDVDVTVSGDLLIVRGERRAELKVDGGSAPLIEGGEPIFTRAIELPEGANIEQISAVLRMGLLKVTIPVPIKRESKKIAVRPAA